MKLATCQEVKRRCEQLWKVISAAQ